MLAPSTSSMTSSPTTNVPSTEFWGGGGAGGFMQFVQISWGGGVVVGGGKAPAAPYAA